MIGRFHALRQGWRFLRLMLRDAPVALAMLNVVGVVALGADEPALGAGAGPFTDPFAMDTFSPVAINLTVAFSTQLLRLVETDRLVAMIDQPVALSGMMTIQAPNTATAVR